MSLTPLYYPPFIIDGSRAPADSKGDWNAAGYQAAVLGCLKELYRWETSRLVLRHIPDSKVRIVPERRHHEPAAGYAGGVLEFTPGKRIKSSKSYIEVKPDAGWTADQGLLHESWHAMRAFAGYDEDDNDLLRTVRVRFFPGVMPQELEFTRRAELLSITAVNVYWSEKNRGRSHHPRAGRDQVLLRSDHEAFNVLLGPQEFHKNAIVKRELLKFAVQQPRVFLQLMQISADFNAFRDIALSEESVTMSEVKDAVRDHIRSIWF